MKVLFAGGGTAGHINPAIAVANYIQERHPEAELYYIGTQRGLESKLVPAAGIRFYTIDVEGFQRKLNWTNIKRNVSAASKLLSADRNARKLLQEIAPDVVMGTGGYVSGPVLREAAKLGIPCCIHEQNAFAGKANKMLAPHMDAVMLAMPEAAKYFKCKKEPVITGNPVRESVIHANKRQARAALGLDDRLMILSFGGSLGARRINEAAADLMAWHWQSGRFQHFHATGKYGVTLMPQLLKERGIDPNAENLHITEYINNMDTMLAAADLVLCRAGAITVSELQAQGKPAILIPSPNVAENHQFFNAMTLVNKNAARILEEKDLTAKSIVSVARELLDDPGKLDELAANARKSAILDTNERIYNVIMALYASR